MNTVLIIGATSGIGEGFAHRLHGQEKTVIAAGRRSQKLKELSEELPGSKTYEARINQFRSLCSKNMSDRYVLNQEF